MKKNICFLLLIFITIGCHYNKYLGKLHEGGWTCLLDDELSEWELFMGVPHTSVTGIGDHPTSNDVHVGVPMGLDNDPKDVFKMIRMDGDDVLHVSGEIYGGLTTKREYENYHLRLKYKWGEKKWEPRLNDKRDAGLLYHCTGPHGAFWNVWMRCLEFQIQESDTGDFIALAGAHAFARGWKPDSDNNYKFELRSEERLGVGEDYNNWLCKKNVNHEKPNDEWNTIDLYVYEDEIIHMVNGQMVNVLEGAYVSEEGNKIPLTKGKIQLQSEAAEIYYKDVKIKSLIRFPIEIWQWNRD